MRGLSLLKSKESINQYSMLVLLYINCIFSINSILLKYLLLDNEFTLVRQVLGCNKKHLDELCTAYTKFYTFFDILMNTELNSHSENLLVNYMNIVHNSLSEFNGLKGLVLYLNIEDVKKYKYIFNKLCDISRAFISVLGIGDLSTEEYALHRSDFELLISIIRSYEKSEDIEVWINQIFNTVN